MALEALFQIIRFELLNDFCVDPINISQPVPRIVENLDFFLICQRHFGIGLIDAPEACEKEVFAN